MRNNYERGVRREETRESKDMELPEACIAAILCRTTPLDVARLSAVCKTFRSAADFDTIWDQFLPSNYQSIISESPSLVNAHSKKALYLALSDHPIIIDQGEKSFQLDRKGGKTCYMLGVRALLICTNDDDHYPQWVALPESRFEVVAKFNHAGIYDISGEIPTVALSSNTQYTVFLVYKMKNSRRRSCYNPVFLHVRISGGPLSSKKVCLDIKLLKSRHTDNRLKVVEFPKLRGDGLLEMEMGEFFNAGLEDGKVDMNVVMTDVRGWKGRFYLEGIEVRPKISGPERNSS